MTMCEPLPPQGLLPMELPSMSSQAGFRAKTSAMQESKLEWVRERDQGYGLRLSDLLANYDPITSSWRTSQHCFLAQVNGVADGLAEFSETWPSAGMMQNGKTYRRQPWALPIAENASGLWPTPTKSALFPPTGAALDARRQMTRGVPLSEAVARKLWPTPQKSDNRDRGNLSSPAVIRRATIGKQLMLSQVVSETSGALNPMWVEWLMGFPQGWTDLAD